MPQIQQNKHIQVMSRLTEILGVRCIVDLKKRGAVPGTIHEIAIPALGDDLQSSIDHTQFKVRLESGEIVTVPGSSISKIGSAV